MIAATVPDDSGMPNSSATLIVTSGRSKTWRRFTPVTGRPARPAPHRPQQPGSWRSSRSGLVTWASVLP